MDLLNVLRKAGLTVNEAKVYLVLLRKGSCKAGRISKEAELNRTSTYNSLKSLLEKGLASYVVIGKVKWFQASQPQNLKKYFLDRLESLEEVLPEFSKIYLSKKLVQNVRLFKGERGVKTVLQDILFEEKPNCIFGSEGQLEERMPIFSKKFIKILESKKIKVRSIVRQGRKLEKSKFREVRFIPESFESPVVTNIYGDKIAIIVWTETPEAILIENETAAKSYKSYFEFMWENALRK